MARDVSTPIDSLNFFIESRNVGNLFNVTTTATGGLSSADIFNTQQVGAMFFITVASITVNTATLRLNINAKDISAGTYFPYVAVSVDGISNTASLQYVGLLYVGAVSTSNVNANVQLIPMPLPGAFQVVSSLTITTSASQTGSLSYRVDYAKVM